jgi:transposase
MKRAQILLAAADGCADDVIAGTLRVGTSTVYRTKRRFVEDGLEQALAEAPRPGQPRKLAAGEEALHAGVLGDQGMVVQTEGQGCAAT